MGWSKVSYLFNKPKRTHQHLLLIVGCKAVWPGPKSTRQPGCLRGVQDWAWLGDGLPMVSEEKHLIDAGKAIVMAADEAG